MQAAATPPSPVVRRRSGPRFLLVVFLLLVAFGAGYVPQWLEVRKLTSTLTTTERNLQLANLHRQIGLASQEAQRSNFASASESARRFFDDCGSLAGTGEFAKDERTRVALLGYAAQRDEVMALLAAGDPVARERLAGIFLAMEGVLARRLEAAVEP
jgi:hypothetical protein